MSDYVVYQTVTTQSYYYSQNRKMSGWFFQNGNLPYDLLQTS